MKSSIKIFIILYLMVSLYGLEISSTMKSYRKRNRRVAHKRSGSQLKLSTREKMEVFFRGFIFGVIGKVLKGKNEDEIANMSSQIIESCGLEALNEYDKYIIDYKNEKGYSDEVFNDAFNPEEREELLSLCSQKKAIDELDDNKFSLFNVVTKGFVRVFWIKNEERIKYKMELDQFRAEKKRIKKEIEVFSDKYKTELIKRKDTVNLEKTKKFIEKANDSLNGLFSDNICEVLNGFIEVDTFHNLLGMNKAALKLVHCGVKKLGEESITKVLEKTVDKLLKGFLAKVAKKAVVAVFPPVIFGFIFKYILEHFTDLSHIVKHFFSFSDRTDDKEKQFFISIGKIFGKEVAGLVFRRRIRKLRKFK